MAAGQIDPRLLPPRLAREQAALGVVVKRKRRTKKQENFLSDSSRPTPETANIPVTDPDRSETP